MVFTVNYRKHLCSFQTALASVDNYMLIITQHNRRAKLTGLQTQPQFKEPRKYVGKLNAHPKGS